MSIRTSQIAGACALSLAVASGCGDRAASWDAPVTSPVAVEGLRNAAVLLDGSLNRALVLRAGADQVLSIDAVPVGKHIATAAASPDGSRVFVLSQGEPTRLSSRDEGPSLTVIEAARPDAAKRYELPDALTALAIDPAGKFAVVYAGDEAGGSFIKNPNELIFVDLSADPRPKENPFLHTLPSNVGGSPKRLTFTPPLHFAAGDPRRLLVVETDRDVVLVELDDPTRPEISLPVSDPRTDARALAPAGIAVDPGDALAPLDRPPVIAIRTATDDNVIVYTLRPAQAQSRDFVPTPNLAFVDGVPSDIAFVRTNQGSRLAALVQAPTPQGLLVKVDDNQTLAAKLTAPYRQMALVAGSGTAAASDQLLLYSAGGSVSSVAIWDLGKVPDAAYNDIDTLKSIETLNLSGSVGSVVSVSDPAIKVLTTGSQSIYVLDLDQHKASPLNTTGGITMRFSLEGDRAWAFVPAAPKLAEIELAGPDVVPVVVDRPVDDVLELARSDGGKSLLAFHGLGANPPSGGRDQRAGVGVTVFDASAPDAATSRRYSSVMLERLSP
jgi:hypothetical protein